MAKEGEEKVIKVYCRTQKSDTVSLGSLLGSGDVMEGS